MARGGTLSVIDLGLLPRLKLQHIESLGLPRLEPPDKTLHRIVFVEKSVEFHQILVDARRISPQAHLSLDPLPVGRAGRPRLLRYPLWKRSWSRWPPRGNLTAPSHVHTGARSFGRSRSCAQSPAGRPRFSKVCRP